MHPRLFTSLVLIEPVITPDTYSGSGPMLSLLSLKRRDTWPSRSKAIEAARKSHKRWDPRVFERWVQNGYRNLPTVLHPRDDSTKALYLDPNDPPVTLASSKHQEVMQYIRPNFGASEPWKGIKSAESSAHQFVVQPDVIGPLLKTTPFYRSEPAIAWKMLDHIRPSVLYIFGGRSPISVEELRTDLVQRTGAGIGGSGGINNSMVKECLFERSGHQVPLEDVQATATAVGEWMKPVVEEWKKAEDLFKEGWENQTAKEKLSVSPYWMPALESACSYYTKKPSKL